MHGEVSTVWRGVHSMHIAFIVDRCPRYGEVSIVCILHNGKVSIVCMVRCPQYGEVSIVCILHS